MNMILQTIKRFVFTPMFIYIVFRVDCAQEEEWEVEPGDRVLRVTYHGIVNLEDDETAQKFGSNLKTE